MKTESDFPAKTQRREVSEIKKFSLRAWRAWREKSGRIFRLHLS
jgi:hypothetical protein